MHCRAGFSWREAWGPARGVTLVWKVGAKPEAPKAPRIEMLKASRGVRNGEGTRLPTNSWSSVCSGGGM